MFFDGSFLLGEFDSCKSTENKVLIISERDQVVLKLTYIEKGFNAFSVWLWSKVFLVVLESRREFMFSKQALDLAIAEELEVRVFGD
jgi:hypothetical protein